MGDKLFKEVLKAIGEYKDNMALIDCLDKLEKLEIIAQADRWMNYRAIRNKLTHEYSTNHEEMIAGIQDVLSEKGFDLVLFSGGKKLYPGEILEYEGQDLSLINDFRENFAHNVIKC